MVKNKNNNNKGINHPFSIIDGKKITVKEAFSWVLNYYNPRKNIPEIMPLVIDGTCGEMLMWHKKDLSKYKVVTNDLHNDVISDYHYDVGELNYHLDKIYDIGIYDPPYINLKKRKDKKKYENGFKYSMISSFEHLEKITRKSAISFSRILVDDGILIAKITDFHHKDKLRGHIDFINWFSKYFYLWDIIIYRFFKPIPNLNFYTKKCAKTHSYFLIFKKEKK